MAPCLVPWAIDHDIPLSDLQGPAEIELNMNVQGLNSFSGT